MRNVIILGVVTTLLGVGGILGVGLTQDHDSLPFYSKDEAYRQGMSAYAGDKIDIAIPALKFASEQGKIEADRILAKIYSNNTSIAHNSFEAFEYFEKYAYHHTNINSKHVYASDVAEAFVALGRYHLAGIPETRLKQNPSQAFVHFKHAATILRDADASYHLARLYITGKGVPKNLRTATKYLKRAYQKNHAAAQAVLGNLFWDGKGVNRNRVLALILLLLANENSDDPNCPGYENSSKRWISKAYDRMLDKVDPTKKIIAQTKFEDLYHPCNGGKALKPIDGIKIDYESDELDQQNNLENIPNRKLDEKSPATQPMTFQ